MVGGLMAKFDARASAENAAAKYPPFEFSGMDGEDYEIPSLMLLPAGERSKLDGLQMVATSIDPDSVEVDPEALAAANEAFDAILDFFGELAGADVGAAVRAMPPVVFGELMAGWEAQVSEQGKELSGSSGLNRAQKRSKQTSRSGAKTSGRSRSTK